MNPLFHLILFSEGVKIDEEYYGNTLEEIGIEDGELLDVLKIEQEDGSG